MNHAGPGGLVPDVAREGWTGKRLRLPWLCKMPRSGRYLWPSLTCTCNDTAQPRTSKLSYSSQLALHFRCYVTPVFLALGIMQESLAWPRTSESNRRGCIYIHHSITHTIDYGCITTVQRYPQGLTNILRIP